MTLNTERTRATAVVEAPGGTPPPPDSASDVSVGELFRRVYQFFYSKTVGLVLILAMAIFVLLGALITQAPKGTFSNPELSEQYLEQMSARFGGWSGIFEFLGLYHVFSSPLFLITTALLGLSIIACTVHRIPQLWQRYRHPRTHVSDRFFDKTRYRATITVPDADGAVLDRVRGRLRAERYRVIDDPRDPGRSLYADKYAWGGFGTVVAHASFVIILVAFVVSSSSGIDDTLSVPVGGAAVEVGHGTGLSVQATSFDASYTNEGQPTDYVSHLEVLRDGEVVAERDVRVNSPLRFDGVKFHQDSFGVGADVRVTGADGSVVFAQSVPLQWTSDDGAESIGGFALPDNGLEVWIATPASGVASTSLAPGQGIFEIYDGEHSQPVLSQVVDPGVPISVGDLSFTFERERAYTGILVRQDPGALWMWIGSALLVLGMMVTFTCRHRRVWIRVEGSTVRLASADKEDLGFERQFTQLADELASVLGGDDPATKEGLRP